MSTTRTERKRRVVKPATETVEPQKTNDTEEVSRDLILEDQLARSKVAREAALAEAAKLNEAIPEEPPVTDEPVVHGETTVDGAPVRTIMGLSPSVATAPMDRKQLIVNQDLVDLLKSIKTTSLGDFENFLRELHPLMELWSNALSEPAARRHALSILLLIKERF